MKNAQLLKYSNSFCWWFFRDATCTAILAPRNRISPVQRAHTTGSLAMSITIGGASSRCSPQRLRCILISWPTAAALRHWFLTIRSLNAAAAKLWSCWRLYLTMSLAKASGASTCLHSDGRTALVLSPLRSTCFHQQNRKWIRRKSSDSHSLGEIFFYCYDDVRDIELSDALNKLMSIIADGLSNGTIQMDEAVREEILDWYVSQPSFIRLICGKQLLETGLLTSADHKYGEMSTVA